MVTFIAAGLLLGGIVLTLFFFGAFKSPYIGLPFFRLALYLLLMLLMLALWYGERKSSYEGNDPAVDTR